MAIATTQQRRRTRRDDGETLRLKEEVRALKERLQVLERITVEKENSCRARSSSCATGLSDRRDSGRRAARRGAT